jgi:hypothetical protein
MLEFSFERKTIEEITQNSHNIVPADTTLINSHQAPVLGLVRSLCLLRDQVWLSLDYIMSAMKSLMIGNSEAYGILEQASHLLCKHSPQTLDPSVKVLWQ